MTEPNTADLALADQRQAAEAEARHLIRSLGPGPTGRDLPDWVALVVVRHLLVRTGDAWRCPHVGTPRPAFAAQWRPGELACQQCATRLRVPDRVACGGCGKTLPARDMVPLALRLSACVFQAVGCRPCWGSVAPVR